MSNDRGSDASIIHPEEKQASASVIANPRPNTAIPDGGFNAWLQVLGAHFLFFNSWGLVNTYGVYQTYYQSTLPQSSSEISWIGTFQGFLLVVIGVITGPIYDRGYFRSLLVLGTFLVVFGMVMTSLATEYYQLFLAQGLCVGLGAGCLFLPSVAVVATYFSTKRAVATGITAAGGSIGGVIYPIIFRELQPSIGFGWATRVIGFIALATLSLSIAVMKPRISPPNKSRTLFDPSAVREPLFVSFSLGLFLAFIGIYFPFFFVPAHAVRILNTSESLAFYLLAVLNAGSVFGRIVPGLVADRFGSMNVLLPCTIIAGVLAFAWLGIHNLAGLVIFCILYGFFSGAIVSLPPTVVAHLSPDMSLLGTRMGMSFSFAGLGLLIGNPIAGAILDIPQGKFWGAQIFGAVTVIAGAVLFLAVRALRAREKKGWRM